MMIRHMIFFDVVFTLQVPPAYLYPLLSYAQFSWSFSLSQNFT